MSGLITPDGGRVDPTPHLAAVASAMARPGQPAATYAALEAAMEAVLGHRLFDPALPRGQRRVRARVDEPAGRLSRRGPQGAQPDLLVAPGAAGAPALPRPHRGRPPRGLLRP